MSEKPEALRLADLCDRHGYMGNIEHNQIAAELRRLHAEFEALRADAGRYRWLLRNYLSFDLCARSLEAGSLDAAIDAAMEQTK